MKLEINPGDRQLAFLLLFTAIVIAISVVTAYNAVPGPGLPATMGHSVDEIDWANPIPGNISVSGDIDVLDNEIKSYKGFPTPNYDSGWVAIGKGTTITLTHGLGGNRDNYVVDLTFKRMATDNIHNYVYGLNSVWPGMQGAAWSALTANQIKVRRGDSDLYVDSVRVRIWVYE